jgi:PAS domain S-box-containing protein
MAKSTPPPPVHPKAQPHRPQLAWSESAHDASAEAGGPASLWRGLGVAAFAVVAITALKLIFPQAIGYPTPFRLYHLAIIAGAWLGGWRAGATTTALAMATGLYFIYSRDPVAFDWDNQIVRLCLFSAEGLCISFLIGRMRTVERRASRLAQEARRSTDKLTVVLDGMREAITMQDAAGRLIFANQEAAELFGFASPKALMNASDAEVMQQVRIADAEHAPLTLSDLPGRLVLESGRSGERLLSFEVAATRQKRWAEVCANPVAQDGRIEFAVNLFRDVTDKRRLEEAERISQEWFSTALRSIGDAVIATDAQGAVTFMNPVAAELTGWPAADASGRPLSEVFAIFDEQTRAAAASPVEQVLRGGSVVGLAKQTVLRRRDGAELPIDDSAAPIRGPAGQLVGVVIVFRDVASKRREEDRRTFLLKATAEFSSSLDYHTTLATVARLAVPEIGDWAAVDLLEDGEVRRLAVAHVDPKKIELVADIERRYPPDPAAQSGTPNILRTGRPEMIRQIPPEMLDAAAQDAEHLQLIRSLALRSYIGVPLNARGKTIGVMTFANAESRRLYTDEDLSFALALADRAAVAIDNARLFHAAEQARRETEAEQGRLRALIATAPAAIAIYRGPEHVFHLTNQLYQRSIGFDPAGHSFASLGMPAPWTERLDQVYRTGETLTMTEHPEPREAPGDGRTSTHYYDFAVQVMRDASGAHEGVATFSIDVTEKVLARQRLEAARAEAEVANRAKDEFLAMLGHELRNPLAPILTALHLMKLRATGVLERERIIIERQVRHLVRLVDDLLDVSRITRGRIELHKEPLELKDVVTSALEMADPLIEDRRHEVAVAVPPGLVVDGDRTRLSQVISNLLNNAAKYMEKGGRIRIEAQRVGDEAVLSVRDRGIGIAPDLLPRVFDLFIQDKQALDRAAGGLGLGLAIVRSLVHLHGGEVTAHSAGPGEGSEFRVRLKLAGQPTPAGEPLTPPPSVTRPLAGALRVLIVDDNRDAADMLLEALKMFGHRVRMAPDGPSALALAAEERPDVALLDIGLPVMDGYELARLLRQAPGLQDIKLIALTGYGQAAERERSSAAGFDAHLVKPCSIAKVQAAIEQLTRERR